MGHVSVFLRAKPSRDGDAKPPARPRSREGSGVANRRFNVGCIDEGYISEPLSCVTVWLSLPSSLGNRTCHAFSPMTESAPRSR